MIFLVKVTVIFVCLFSKMLVEARARIRFLFRKSWFQGSRCSLWEPTHNNTKY